jgi:replication factor A2
MRVNSRIISYQVASANYTRNDTYVRVSGQLKSFHNKRHIGAHNIRRITDHNEVLYHLLEATAIHLYHTRGPPNASNPGGQRAGAYEPMDGVVNTGVTIGGAVSGAANSELDRLQPLQKQIMIYVHGSPGSNEGVHIQSIAQAVRTPIATVMKAVEDLTQDGLLYTTIDEDHVHSYVCPPLILRSKAQLSRINKTVSSISEVSREIMYIPMY